MNILSDTLHYRPDGTVSGVTRIIRESYKTPSGRDVTEDVTSTVSIEDVTALLDQGYAQFDAHNKTLEAQIITEREEAETEKQRIAREAAEAAAAALAAKERAHEDALAVKEAEIARRDEVISQKDAEIAAERAKASAVLETAEAVKA